MFCLSGSLPLMWLSLSPVMAAYSALRHPLLCRCCQAEWVAWDSNARRFAKGVQHQHQQQRRHAEAAMGHTTVFGENLRWGSAILSSAKCESCRFRLNFGFSRHVLCTRLHMPVYYIQTFKFFNSHLYPEITSSLLSKWEPPNLVTLWLLLVRSLLNRLKLIKFMWSFLLKYRSFTQKDILQQLIWPLMISESEICGFCGKLRLVENEFFIITTLQWWSETN